MHDIVTCHKSKRLRQFLEYNGVPNLKWPGNLPKMNFIDNVLIIRKKEVGNQLLCLKEERWKRVCKTCSTKRPCRNLQFNAKDNCRSYSARGGATSSDFMM